MVTTTSCFESVQSVLNEHLTDFDVQAAEALLTTVLANELSGDPVWLILIAPPSSGKTLLLVPLEGIWDCELISNLTPNTFLSGAWTQAGGDPSLLNRLGDRPFVAVKDLSTILESHPHDRSEIFAQLRGIYDGEISKSYGTGVTRSWSGKLTLVMGMTGAIDKYDSLRAELGERFLRLRFRPPKNRLKLAKQSAQTSGVEEKIRDELHESYKEALKNGKRRLEDPDISEESISRLAALATVTARVRTTVDRGLKPEPELPPRLMNQLLKFAQAQCALRGWRDVEDWSLLRRLTIDAIPEPRRGVFREAGRKIQEDGAVRVKDLDYMSGSTRQRELRKLVQLDVLERETSDEAPSEKGGRPEHLYCFDEDFEPVLDRTGGLFQKS